MADWVIEPITATHGRAEFCSGEPQLDKFLNTLVTQYEKRHLGRTFVAVEAGTSSIKGYYTLSAGAFDVSCLPIQQRKKLPRHPCPTIHLARLAVDQAFCGQGLGEMLLMHALRSALDLSHKLGSFAVDVWAISDQAALFHQKYGFVRLEDAPRHLYLPIKTVGALFKSG